ESNFALLMGGEKAFASLVRGLLDAYQADFPDDPLVNVMSDYFDYVIEKVADFTAIEHNRVYVPKNANFLTFETTSPWLITPNVELRVTITPVDEGLAPMVTSIRLEP